MLTLINFAHGQFSNDHFFYLRVQLYIDNGWNKTGLKDPDGGIHGKTVYLLGIGLTKTYLETEAFKEAIERFLSCKRLKK